MNEDGDDGIGTEKGPKLTYGYQTPHPAGAASPGPARSGGQLGRSRVRWVVVGAVAVAVALAAVAIAILG